MEAFYAAMSSVKASAEWPFGDISNSFKFVDFKKNLKRYYDQIVTYLYV